MVSKKAKKDTAIAKEVTKELLSLMSIKADINVEEDKENDALVIKIDAPEETGLIIGSRGRTLNSLQVILGMLFKKRTGEWRRILVDVSGWRDKEKERLENLAELTAERAKATGEQQYLYNLTSSQRRIVHMFLAGKKNMNTESQGEGKDRCLVVTSKN